MGKANADYVAFQRNPRAQMGFPCGLGSACPAAQRILTPTIRFVESCAVISR
ncbi:hypothetical protein JOD47_001767 [Arthrobacter tumbae]|nr:hypothetical protein [Arthrobacter tumbae]